MEAVKQGSATVGVKSKNHAVLVALKRASSELSAYQKKIMNLDDHMGMSIAGLTADAKRWVIFHKVELDLWIFTKFMIFQFEPLDENRVLDIKILSQLSPKIGNSNERFGKQNAKLYPIV